MASSVPPPRAEDPFADRRASPRVEVALPAFLQAGGDRYSVHLLDLSAGGAKVTCAAALPIASTVTLDCGPLCRPAVIRWQNAGVHGLCFESELDTRDLADLVQRSRALASRLKARE